jgi:hypothetical protein
MAVFVVDSTITRAMQKHSHAGPVVRIQNLGDSPKKGTAEDEGYRQRVTGNIATTPTPLPQLEDQQIGPAN